MPYAWNKGFLNIFSLPGYLEFLLPVPQQKSLELTILGKMRQPKHFEAKISPTYIPLHLSAEQDSFFPVTRGSKGTQSIFGPHAIRYCTHTKSGTG